MSQHSVFIIEDDLAVRDSLLTVLRGAGIRARGFSSGIDFLDNLPRDASACVITDMRMPGMEGDELVRRLAGLRGPTWPVIVITGHADVPMAVQLMKAGVVDFIEKPFDPAKLIGVVQTCLTRLSILDEEQNARSVVQTRLARLTPRERQVFRALVEGASNKQIALDLEISPRTVEVFRAKVMSKMEVDNLPALVRAGLIVG